MRTCPLRLSRYKELQTSHTAVTYLSSPWEWLQSHTILLPPDPRVSILRGLSPVHPFVVCFARSPSTPNKVSLIIGKVVPQHYPGSTNVLKPFSKVRFSSSINIRLGRCEQQYRSGVFPLLSQRIGIFRMLLS